MKVLIDTNVIIDALTMRDNYSNNSKDVIRKIFDDQIKGYISAKQITDIYYILRKYCHDELDRRNIIKMICKTFEILPTTKSDIMYCINSNVKDFEDALLFEVAKVNCINCIITNNIKDFEDADVVAMLPENFLSLTI